MKAIGIEQGGVYDWPLVNQLLSEDPKRIALVPAGRTFPQLPESKLVIVPWLQKNIIYICTLEQAKLVMDVSKACVERWRVEQEALEAVEHTKGQEA